MQAVMTSLHTLVSTIPLALQCIALSTLFLSWFGAHLAIEYAARLQRPITFAAYVAGLCGPPTVLLLLGLLTDALGMHDYGKLRLLGVLAVLLLLVGGLCQRACQAAANRSLRRAGYLTIPLPMTPVRTQKTRDS